MQGGAGIVVCVPHSAHWCWCISRLSWQLTSAKTLLNGQCLAHVMERSATEGVLIVIIAVTGTRFVVNMLSEGN